MKKVLHHAYQVFAQSCICFTLLTLFLFLIGSAVPAFGDAIAVDKILSVYLFSLLLAIANLLLVLPRIKIGFRVLLHYIASLAAFYGVFILIGLKITLPRSILVALLLFTVFYAIIMGIYLFLYFSVVDEKAPKEVHYKSVFK